MPRPYVLLSVATSIDGYIDDTTTERLLLSNAQDFDRVDQVRAESDAILIGATTMRRDNPRLLVNNDCRRSNRVTQGLPEYPLKVTITASGQLDRELKFWHYGGAKIAYTTDAVVDKLRQHLAGLATVISTGAVLDFQVLLDDLGDRGVRRLLVEGGGTIHTQLLANGLADEIHLAIAPVIVGDAAAPRFLNPANYPGAPKRRMVLAGVRAVGDVALLRYLPKEESAG